MGSNFYLIGPDGARGEHIGKLSGAGLYCFNCDLSLVTGLSAAKAGRDIRANPHFYPLKHEPTAVSRGLFRRYSAWRPVGEGPEPAGMQCVNCREVYDPAAGNEQPIRYVFSFTYAMNPEMVARLPDNTPVTEYGSFEMTTRELREMLGEDVVFRLKGEGVFC